VLVAVESSVQDQDIGANDLIASPNPKR